MKLKRKEGDEFGVNGIHSDIGKKYTNDEFKGRVLEFIRNHELAHVKMENDIELNKQMLWLATGGFTVILLSKQIGLW